MVSKLLIGIIVGFVLGGGATYYTYANQINVALSGMPNTSNLTQNISKNVNDVIFNSTTLESKYTVNNKFKDCSIYEIKKLPMNEMLKLSEKEQYEQHKRENNLAPLIECNEYNREIQASIDHAKWVEEQRYINGK